MVFSRVSERKIALFIGRCANIDGNIGNPRTPAAREWLIPNPRWGELVHAR